MNFGKTILSYANVGRLSGFSRLSALALAAGAFHSGCMESSPGGSQGEAQSQPQVLRAMAANPLCKVETHVLILDEDAIRNAERCDCVQDRDHEADSDEDKRCRRSGSGSGSGSGGQSKQGSGGRDSHGSARSGYDDDRKGKNCSRNGDKYGRDDDDDDDDDEGHGGKREGHVTICHIPPGNHGNGHTITVGSSSLKAHLAHGDKVSACPEIVPPCNGGGYGKGNCARRESDFEKASCETSAVGKRTPLKWFADNVGREIVLPSGSVGDEGWFAPTTIRIAWKSAGPEIGDGLRNYVAAGPGLGKPDAKGNRESLLDNVPDLTPLRAMGLARLEGASICGIVLDGEVKMTYNPRSGNIQGPNLGKVAFQVLGTERASGQSSLELPGVRVRILDAEAVCADPLTPYLNAPAPTSQCEPRDVDRPSCSVLKTLVSDPWNVFDSTLWRGDGDQMVGGGFFFAREGAGSAAADYISPCPVPVESSSAVRFTNRLQLVSPDQANYAESGALFFVNADNDGSFNNYVFINVGYTTAPGKVYVELFGSNNGVDFDQFEETSLAYSPSQIFNVDLWIQPNSYQIAVGEEIIDTVRLATPIQGIGLFEVGVQQAEGGLRGSIDMTTIAKMCQKEKASIHRCRGHSMHRNMRKERMGKKCRNRNSYIRLAKERIKHCERPSMGLRMLAKMKEKPD
ncbi:MAG TPA: hypothetical protein VJ385_19415 [Fibrobacteria bacterium]|nr:hypothetical protein [Fibrobacteria bacterium]